MFFFFINQSEVVFYSLKDNVVRAIVHVFIGFYVVCSSEHNPYTGDQSKKDTQGVPSSKAVFLGWPGQRSNTKTPILQLTLSH